MQTIFQCNDPSTFKDIYEYVENGDESGGHGSINIHGLYQKNGLKPFINLNNSDDIEINDNLKNGDMSRGIVLLNSQYLS